jgi:flagellar basal-body rod protein FlgF
MGSCEFTFISLHSGLDGTSILSVARLVLGWFRMNLSLYQAAAALDGNIRWQQMVAENLAASSTPGFKKQDITFSSLHAGVLGGSPENPSILPSPHLGINFADGELKATRDNKEIALSGPGFLSVQMPNGQTAYTRDGAFHVSPQGQLLNKNNYELLGEGGPIQVDPRASEAISISDSGVVSQGGIIRGKLNVVEFADRNELTRVGGGYYLAKPEVQSVAATQTQVMQGFQETSNAVPMSELSNLLLALRHFEANQRVIQMQDERMGRAIQELSATN